MATVNPPAPVGRPAPETGTSIGLFWGGAMLGLFGSWLVRDQTDVSMIAVGIVWLLAAASILGGLWQWSVSHGGNAAKRIGVRLAVGRMLILGGIVLAGLSSYLGWKLGLDGVGQSVGLGLFSLATILAGFARVLSAQARPGVPARLAEFHIGLRNLLLAIGVVCMVTFAWLAWLAFGRKLGIDFIVQKGPLVFEGLLCLTCGFWLTASTPESRTPLAIRSLLLIVGGVSGLILTLLSLGLAYIWRQDVFLDGIGGWKGEHGYRIWICAYVGLTGLMLMFGSLLLVRSEVRTNPMLRQTLYGYNAVVSGFLLLAILAVFNVVAYAVFPTTLQWNQSTGLTDLAKSTKNFLGNMNARVTIYMLLPQTPRFAEVRALVGNCAAQTEKLTVKNVTDRETLLRLAEKYPELRVGGQGNIGEIADGLLLEQATVPKGQEKASYEFIPARKLFTTITDNNTGKSSMVFNGEVELMRQLTFLLQGKKQRKIYFLQGQEELDVNENGSPRFARSAFVPLRQYGAGFLAEKLRTDNYLVEGLSFASAPKTPVPGVVYAKVDGPDRRKDVPADAWALVIAGPSAKMSRETLAPLERFMDRGGRMLVTLDLVLNQDILKLKADKAEEKDLVLDKSGIEGFLKKYGVNVADTFVMRDTGSGVIRNPDPRFILATPPLGSDNVLAKRLFGNDVPMQGARIVKAERAGRFNGEILLQADPEVYRGPIWEESNLIALEYPSEYVRQLKEMGQYRELLSLQSLPVAVAVSEEGEKTSARPRLVVFGDTDFISNYSLQPRGPYAAKCYSIFVSALEWMGERQDFVGPRGRVSQEYILGSTASLNRMLYIPLWLMGLGIFGFGTGVWMVRRR